VAHAVHECPRCGHQDPYRTHWTYDELIAWIQHCDALEHDLHCQVARLQNRLAKALQEAEMLRALVTHLEVPSLDQLEIRALREPLEPRPTEYDPFADVGQS
jgi:hypothetical protein